MERPQKQPLTAPKVRRLRRWRLIYKSMRRIEYEHERYRQILISLFWDL